MKGPGNLLPPGFEALESFAATWALPTTADRARMRGDSSAEARAAFYEAATPLLPAAIALLDQKPLNALDEAEARLMNLMLTLGHVSLAIEVQGPEETNHRRARDQMRITRSPADHPARKGQA